MKISAKATKTAKTHKSWLQLQQSRLQHIRFGQRRNKVASDLIELKVENGSKQMQQQRMLRVRNFFRRATRKDFEYTGTFQEAIKPVMVLAQIFALIPVAGVCGKSAASLHFSWRYVRTWYSFIVIICFAITTGFTIAYATTGKFNFDSVESVIFYASIFLIASAFLHLATKWPRLMLQWEEVELQLPPLRTQMQKAQLAYHVKMITLVTTVCSMVEHMLSMLSVIYYANACPAIPDEPISSFLLATLSQFFYFVPYNDALGLLGKVLNVLSTFAWNFNDIFVMVVSTALAARFRQLNEHMLRYGKRPTTESFWIENRVNYRNLCKLCEAVDDTISIITMLSFSNNLYFICSKILKSLQKKPSFTHTLYFWFSLVYLLTRTLMLSLYSAEINDESRRPLIVFRAVPREYWCRELKRFSEEVSTDVVALTGMKFFQLTRGLVLTVAGTIVTYELVLLQFSKDKKVNDCFEN